MKKIKKSFFVVVFAILLIVGSFSLKAFFNKDQNHYINKVLKNKAYAYLSEETKEFIKDVYETTGEVVLTEKNKVVNTPYLNPQYDYYLSLSDEEREEMDLIPGMYVVDYQDSGNVEKVALPSTYNLNNVLGNNYLTPINDQGNLGLCWVFASIEQAESKLMVENNQSYSPSSQRFSIRQMDYATSMNGINNYENENAFRSLTTGGNFYMSSSIMSYGLSLTEYEEYNELVNKKELADVLNYGNSLYELESSIYAPILSLSASEEDRYSYIDFLKTNIIYYGGAYVGTGSPNGNCGFQNIDGSYAFVDADNCVGSSGHAMQIIGWDDNYEYSYCKSGSSHLSVNELGTCSTGTLVTGIGAWILRNSWGEDSDYKTVYMGYSSYGYEVGFTTSLVSMNDRTWDNNYHKNIWKNNSVDKTSDTITFRKKINSSEIVKKVKFMSATSFGEYSISIESGSNVYNNIKSFEVERPGIYTIDLSDENIILTEQQFQVTINSTNGAYLSSNTISVFTSNVEDKPLISTMDIVKSGLDENNYEISVYSLTKNIDSNEAVTYSLHSNNSDYSNYILSVSNNRVAENNINASLVIDENIPAGNYTLKVHYNDSYSESVISIAPQLDLQGSGTSADPYQIYNENDLNQIRFSPDAYYVLKNDISLTEEWQPIGTYSSPFRGGIDGDNHTISGLTINANIDDPVGLFGYVDVKYKYLASSGYTIEETYIKNLIISNAQVTNFGDAGILIGEVIYNTNRHTSVQNPYFKINNVHFVGGSVTSTNGDAGVLISNISIIPRGFIRPYLEVNNLFSSVAISGSHSSGLIGFINDAYQSAIGICLQINMSNFQNVGVIDVKSYIDEDSDENYYSPVVGGKYGNANITIKDYIINSIFNDANYTYFNFIDDNYLKYASDYSYYTTGYYVSKFSSDFNDYEHRNIISSVDAKDSSLYSSWEEFNEYWKIETIDGIIRIPVLKNINYNYTSIPDISLKRYDEVSLLDYINGPSDYQYVEYSLVTNANILKIEDVDSDNDCFYDDIIIKALNKGIATIHVINHYDGFEKDITITVSADKVDHPTITYYSNNDSTETFSQQVNALESFTLMANTFTRQFFTFAGWNTVPDGTGTSYSDQDVIELGIDENLHLYAQWELIVYTVVYDPNGGTGTMSNHTNITFPYAFTGSTYIDTNTYTKEGYTFTGWNTKADGTGKSYAKQHGSIPREDFANLEGTVLTLYAQWEIDKYTVTFYANGGTGTMSSQEIVPNTPTNLNSNTFTRSGYQFTGWNTSPDGSGTAYTNGQSVTLSGNLTLYAQWTAVVPYTIHNYTVDETNKYISHIMVNTEVNNFTPNFTIGYGYGIDVDYKTINNKQVLYTGGKTRITHGLTTYIEYTNVVIGDNNGDGAINSADLLKVRQHLLSTNILSGAYFLASDINYDSIINSADLLRVRQHLLGTKTIG